MKPEVNAVLAEVKASLAQTHQPAPLMPDFKAMSIMQATKWCIENGITSPKVISETTGKESIQLTPPCGRYATPSGSRCWLVVLRR
jgi:hypothetical protein